MLCFSLIVIFAAQRTYNTSAVDSKCSSHVVRSFLRFLSCRGICHYTVKVYNADKNQLKQQIHRIFVKGNKCVTHFS